MLLGSFFNIIDKKVTDSNLAASLELNGAHPIFEGHFPGQPVVPGVCMLQMIKEVLETLVGKKLLLQKSDFLKFLTVINPVENKVISIEFSYINGDAGTYILNGRLFKDAVTFLKFKTTFR